MPLPSAVQAQVDHAERLQAQIASEQEAAANAANDQAGESPAAQGDPNATTQQPVPVAPTTAPAPLPVTAEDDPNSETWKSRFRTLQGMFNAEVPKLQRANAALEQQMRDLAETVRARAQPPEQSATASGNSSVTQADVDAFGQDLIDLIRRVTGGGDGTALHATVNKLQADVDGLKSNVGTVSERVVVNDRDRFLTAMEKLVPDWKAVDEMPQWLDWLTQYDPMLGDTRQAALVVATNAMQADRVAAFFNAFKATLAPATGARPTASREQQRQVAPPRTRSAPQPMNGAAKVWTGREIGQFYDEARRGLHTPETVAAIEQQINAAMEEGRIAP
jgi:hypothetical protein